MKLQTQPFTTDLTVEEMTYINGGQCDCESGGVAAAKSVKSAWNTAKSTLESMWHSYSKTMTEFTSTSSPHGTIY